jgi:trans-2,3-dihydro-3-hydroxyanthranilate isomerase
MRSFHYCTCDVFTDRLFGGNPLAVLTDARGLDAATMQAVAREFNYSETVFVLPPADPRHTARLRIFTPGGELPFAGHPTVGTAFALAAVGAAPAADEVVFEEGVGPVRVTIERQAGAVTACTLTAAQLPVRGTALPSRAELAPMLGLDPADLSADAETWSCGVPFTVVPLTSADALARVRLNMDRWGRLLAGHEGRKVYPVAQTGEGCWRVRMFAPSLGVAEDAATGSAAAAFAGWLVTWQPAPDGTRRWRIQQGEAIGRPSEIALEADVRNGAPAAVRVGGRCVMVSEGSLRL